MSKKDYQLIADAIKEAKDATCPDHIHALNALQRAAVILGRKLAADYRGGYSFDRDRFLTACGF